MYAKASPEPSKSNTLAAAGAPGAATYQSLIALQAKLQHFACCSRLRGSGSDRRQAVLTRAFS